MTTRVCALSKKGHAECFWNGYTCLGFLFSSIYRIVPSMSPTRIKLHCTGMLVKWWLCHVSHDIGVFGKKQREVPRIFALNHVQWHLSYQIAIHVQHASWVTQLCSYSCQLAHYGQHVKFEIYVWTRQPRLWRIATECSHSTLYALHMRNAFVWHATVLNIMATVWVTLHMTYHKCKLWV